MTYSKSHATVLKHLPFEDLGSLEPELRSRGFSIATIDVPTAKFPAPELADCDLLVVLGGPIGVYDTEEFPFLHDEILALRQRLGAGKATLGICLGAQLMAAALGARVYPGACGAEIGWFPLAPGTGSPIPEWFTPLLAADLPVFHWHGDTFDLPEGATHLARTGRYQNQAFSVGDSGLALQFHPEVTADGLERWYVGHIAELRSKAISVNQLRMESERNAFKLQEAAAAFWKGWLDHIL